MVHTTPTTQHISNRPSSGALVRWGILLFWIASLILGQLGRVPLANQGGGVLLSDIANVVVILYAMSFPRTCLPAGRRRESTPVFIAPFLIWSLFILLLHIGSLSGSDLLISLSYWMRLATSLALLPAFFALFSYQDNKKLLKPLMLMLVGALVILGYAQLLIYPSMQSSLSGWDPHIFRMFGTWLDPNFFGAFLAMTLPYILLLLRKSRWMAWCVPISILIAILLTQSRSTFIALLIAIMMCGCIALLRSQLSLVAKRVLALAMILGVASIALGVTVLGDRAENIFLHDPTIALRSDAYTVVWRNLVEPNIFLGVGYNAYQFAAKDAGIIGNFSIHSRAGSDSSILTLLVITGIIGLTLFLAPICIAVAYHVRRFLVGKQLYSLCFVWASVVLLIQSQFTNSLLYSHILMTYIFCFIISSLYE